MIENNLIYHVIILDRTQIIDRYISYVTASISKKWINCDTTNYKINFNINDYKSFKEYHKYCYDNYFRIVKNYTYIEYSDIINRDSIIGKIKDIFPKLILKKTLNECLKKQNNHSNYYDKIINYDEVKNFIEEELKL